MSSVTCGVSLRLFADVVFHFSDAPSKKVRPKRDPGQTAAPFITFVPRRFS